MPGVHRHWCRGTTHAEDGIYPNSLFEAKFMCLRLRIESQTDVNIENVCITVWEHCDGGGGL